MAITCFRGRYTKLGNYSPCCIFYEGHAYNSVEHAYQAQKSIDPAIQKMIRDAASAAQSKKIARAVQIRSDWDEVKVPIMLTLLREKFSQEPERSVLLATGEEELVEGNWWHDTFWGQCPIGTGENHLGKLLMQVRKEQSRGNFATVSETYSPQAQ